MLFFWLWGGVISVTAVLGLEGRLVVVDVDAKRNLRRLGLLTMDSYNRKFHKLFRVAIDKYSKRNIL